MRQKVFEATGGLTCSAGLANNFMLSKIASDLNKPNGQCIVGPTNKEILNFLRPMKVRKIGGIGRVTEKILNAFGIKTVQELYDHRTLVQFIFGSVGWRAIPIQIARMKKRSRWDKRASARNEHSVQDEHGVK